MTERFLMTEQEQVIWIISMINRDMDEIFQRALFVQLKDMSLIELHSYLQRHGRQIDLELFEQLPTSFEI